MKINWDDISAIYLGSTIEHDVETQKHIMRLNDQIHGRTRLNYRRYIYLLAERMGRYSVKFDGYTVPLHIWESTEVLAYMKQPGFSFYERFLKLYFEGYE